MLNRLNAVQLPHAAEPLSGVITAGQPNPDQLSAARDLGVHTVVNLCPDGECGWNEGRVVESLGMRYIGIPVRGAGDITPENAQRLQAVLGDESARPILLHCGTGNRAGALLAATLFHCQNCDLEEAIAAGRRAGLTKLEAEVRACLGHCRSV